MFTEDEACLVQAGALKIRGGQLTLSCPNAYCARPTGLAGLHILQNMVGVSILFKAVVP